MKSYLAIGCALLVSSCASRISSTDSAQYFEAKKISAADKEQLKESVKYTQQGLCTLGTYYADKVVSPSRRAGAKGYVTEICEKNLNGAVVYYTSGARIHDEYSIAALTRLNKPVPIEATRAIELYEGKPSANPQSEVGVSAGDIAGAIFGGLLLGLAAYGAAGSGASGLNMADDDPVVIQGNRRSLSASQQPIIYNKVGTSYMGSNGTVVNVNGNTASSNSGTTYIRSGNLITGSDGSSAIVNGNSVNVYRSNGSSALCIGTDRLISCN